MPQRSNIAPDLLGPANARSAIQGRAEYLRCCFLLTFAQRFAEYRACTNRRKHLATWSYCQWPWSNTCAEVPALWPADAQRSQQSPPSTALGRARVPLTTASSRRGLASTNRSRFAPRLSQSAGSGQVHQGLSSLRLLLATASQLCPIHQARSAKWPDRGRRPPVSPARYVHQHQRC